MEAHGNDLLDGRYRLVEQLGVGGMAVVLRGYDEVLGRQVAVKVLAPTLTADDSFRRRIRIEAQAAARLCHPHITNVYDYGEADGPDGTTVPYVVMELVDGSPLSARLACGAALPWRDAVIACAEVASALAAAHARGVVHRDITPSNVMLTDAGAKVVDFGISAVAGDSDRAPDGSLLGTPAYVAPERLDAGTVSPATDVYALGVLLYRSLTGRLPWNAVTTTQMLIAHRNAEPEPMPAVDGLPGEVVELCGRCLAKRPEDRPTSAFLARSLAGVVGITALVPVSPAGPAAGPDGSTDDLDLASANTTILPLSTALAALPRASRVRPRAPFRPRAPRPPGASRPTRSAFPPAGPTSVLTRRRVEGVLVGVGLVAIAGLIWAGTAWTPEGGSASGPQGSALGAGTQDDCRVDYRLDRDTGGSFAASLTVTNIGREAVEGWRLRFAFPGEQRLTGISSGTWDQSGRTIVVQPASGGDRLVSGDSMAFSVAGSYRGTNSLPTAFDLDGKSCRAVVSGPVGGSGDGGSGSGGPGGGGPGSGGPGGGGPGSQNGGTGAGTGAEPANPGSGHGGNGRGGGGNSGPSKPRPTKTKKPKDSDSGGSVPIPLPSLPLPTVSSSLPPLLP